MSSIPKPIKGRIPEPVLERWGAMTDEMETLPGAVYDRIPDPMKPAIKHGYHIVSPTASWSYLRRRERARSQFAEDFFGQERYDQLWTEFFDESDIVDIVMSGLEEVGDQKVVFDTHRGVAAHVYALIRTWKPDRIVSSGVYSGVGTASMLLALRENEHGTLYTVDDAQTRAQAIDDGMRTDGNGTTPSDGTRATMLEHIARGRPSCSEHRSHLLPEGKEPGWIVPDELKDRWVSRLGSPRDELPKLYSELPDIDIYYHDSEYSTSGMLFEYELAWEWLKPGGMLISPHIDRNDAFETFVTEREAPHGLLEFDYLASSEYDVPCSCGYVMKSA
ncbi:class I SAM-dependent methyltransferase [Natronosalvus amylolyticus]|uniref:class I SAM-dependent methyltransferase n=1 Tax=Natronosalvus amylolyticus TaxID=2961994 RepID=UPI0020C93F75|nr:class I SAM-dependent methyltransferase [Natronosalvus amylolyticus]